jgi:hypothetical protein
MFVGRDLTESLAFYFILFFGEKYSSQRGTYYEESKQK